MAISNISYNIWQYFLCNYYIIAKATLLQNHYIVSKHKYIIKWIKKRHAFWLAVRIYGQNAFASDF